MRPPTWLVLTLLFTAAPAAAGPEEHARVRPLDPDAVRIVEAVRAKSPTARRLLERLERSDLITYVQLAAGFQLKPRATTRIITTTRDTRYVLISISTFTSQDDRLELLGHELQHAVELAASPDVRDDAGMERMYARIGWRENTRSFETAEAQRAGRVVRAEMSVRTAVRRAFGGR